MTRGQVGKCLLLILAFLLLNAHCLRVRLDKRYIEKANDVYGAEQQSCYEVDQAFARGNTSFVTQNTQCVPSGATDSTRPLSVCFGVCGSTTFDTITSTTIAAVESLITSSLTTLTNLISLKNEYRNFPGVSSGRCQFDQNFGVPIPSEYASSDSSYDLVIFLTMRPLEDFVKVQGMYCETSGSSGRPIMGVLNVPPIVSTYSTRNAEAYIMQQLMYIFGFHVEMFNTRPDMEVVQFSKQYTGYTETLYHIVSPKAVEEARNHFNCHDATVDKIILLENKMGQDAFDATISKGIYSHLHVRDKTSSLGDDRKPYSILEKRVFGNDIMTGSFEESAPSAPTISRITLAIMEDLGFYDVSYDSAKDFVYGRGMGCTFLTQKCATWDSSRTGYFCTDIDPAVVVDEAKGCTFDHIRKGICTATRGNAFTVRYRQLDSSTEGGQDEWRDYCPWYTGNTFSAGLCTEEKYSKSETFKEFGEQYGTNSRCFVSTAKRDLYANTEPIARCYQTACGVDNSTVDGQVIMDYHLFIKVGSSKWRKCPYSGGAVRDFDDFTGVVNCPPASVICKSSTFNFNSDIITQSRQSTTGGNVKDQIRNLPYWIWIIIGVVVGLVALITLIVIGVIVIRKFANKDWETKKTVDLRADDVDIEH